MKILKVFIIVPSNADTSPIRGAAALANALSAWATIYFVTLKKNQKNLNLLNNEVEWISLGEYSSWLKKIRILKLILKKAGDKKTIATISSSFSADFINSLCTNLAVTVASVRGNLPVVYVNTYGIFGGLFALFHLKRLNKISHVVSMTESMSRQVESYIKRSSPIIGNFIDEKKLNHFKNNNRVNGKFKIIFVGSLIHGKQPLLLIDSIFNLIRDGKDVQLDILGEGELLEKAISQVRNLGISDSVNFHGYVKEPYSFISSSDILVLPSLSEGVSRSVLEALFLGVPCVLRDVDGSSEIIQEGLNGVLFEKDDDLIDAILHALKLSRNRTSRSSLLPDNFRQQYAARKYLDLIESNL